MTLLFILARADADTFKTCREAKAKVVMA